MNNGTMIIAAVAVVFIVGVYFYTKTIFWKRYLLRKATIFAAKGKVGKMLSLLERNRNRKSVSDPLTNALIFFNIRSNRLEEAEKMVNEAVKLGDDSANAIAQLGFIAGARGDSGKAEQYYRTALEKDNSLKSTLNVNLAALMIERNKNLDEAETLLREVLDMRQGAARSSVHVNLAMVYLARREGRKALVQALTGYELLPGIETTKESRAHALAIAAKANEILGEMEEAGNMASKAAKLVKGLPTEKRLREQLNSIL